MIVFGCDIPDSGEDIQSSTSTSAITLLMVYMAFRKLYRDGGGDNSPHPRVTDWAFST